MTVVVDTSILIDHLRGHEPAHVALRRAAEAGEHLVASVLTKVETLAGMNPRQEHVTRSLLNQLDWIEVDDALAEAAGRLANRYLRSHPGVDPVDYVIAATAERLKAQLWTRNLRHFPMFGGLKPPY